MYVPCFRQGKVWDDNENEEWSACKTVRIFEITKGAGARKNDVGGKEDREYGQSLEIKFRCESR